MQINAAKVLIDGPSELVFDYAIPESLAEVAVGCRVRIPLRNRNATGTVLEIGPPPQSNFALRPLHSLIDPEPLITPNLMKLGKWLAKYYGTPMEQVMRALLPESVRQDAHSEKTRKVVILEQMPDDEEKKGYVSLKSEAVRRDPDQDQEFMQSSPLTLNDEQATALAEILKEPASGESKKPILLQGVTGSGKTEVYLQAVQHHVDAGRSALILVPEISLTPQTVQRFKSRFADLQDKVAVLHSHLSQGERFDEWHRIRKGFRPSHPIRYHRRG